VRIVRPVDAPAVLPVVLYVHGGGWILGNAGTHDRLVRELAVGAETAVVFVEYDRSPEAHHPVAIEQAYATARCLGHVDVAGRCVRLGALEPTPRWLRAEPRWSTLGVRRIRGP
jgi:acetyl esterase/lipase